MLMRTNAPQLVTWIIAVVSGGLGIISRLVDIPALPVSSFGLGMIGFLILVFGTVFSGI
jgi:hypothetical protein